MICSGLKVSAAESGLESCPFIVASLYSRDFRKEEAANDAVEVCPLRVQSIGCTSKGHHRIGIASFSRFTMVKSLRLAGSEPQFIYTLIIDFWVRVIVSKLMRLM